MTPTLSVGITSVLAPWDTSEHPVIEMWMSVHWVPILVNIKESVLTPKAHFSVIVSVVMWGPGVSWTLMSACQIHA